MASNYLIPEPTEELSLTTSLGEGKGTYLAVSQSSEWYAFKPNDSTETWWVIGMMASNGSYVMPVVVSNTKEYAYTYSSRYYSNNDPLSDEVVSFNYEGATYYASHQSYGATTYSPSDITIQYYEGDDVSSNIETMAKKLIEQYLADGGTLPNEEPESPSDYEKIEYTLINWKDDEEPNIDAEHLNKMDQAISSLCKQLDIVYNEFNKKIDDLKTNAVTTAQS